MKHALWCSRTHRNSDTPCQSQDPTTNISNPQHHLVRHSTHIKVIPINSIRSIKRPRCIRRTRNNSTMILPSARLQTATNSQPNTRVLTPKLAHSVIAIVLSVVRQMHVRRPRVRAARIHNDGLVDEYAALDFPVAF